MKIDVFSEVQKARPWTSDDPEQQVLEETLQQAKLADELGYECWWEVEHHTFEEFSYSPAPEVILAAISQLTSRIRIGHAAVLAPFNFNHPVRIAERAATLDRLSRGRLEMGFARSTPPEWRLFNVDPDRTRNQLQQAMEMIPQMWTQDSFSWDSEELQIHDRNIIPKPYQKPHPPLWQACTSVTSFEQAGRNGVGVLGVTLSAPLEAIAEMVAVYRKAISECERPVGKFINNQVALFTFAHCMDTEQEAVDNGASAAAAWYSHKAMTLFEGAEAFLQQQREYEASRDVAGAGLVGIYAREAWEAIREGAAESPRLQLMRRILAGEQISEEELYRDFREQPSMIVGDVDSCREKMKAYEEAGIDRLMTFHQVASIRHEQIVKSMRNIATLIPEFQARDRAAAKVTT